LEDLGLESPDVNNVLQTPNTSIANVDLGRILMLRESLNLPLRRGLMRPNFEI
jgi:hypothetical protein